MRDKLGILLMEEEDGTVAVQLYSDPDKFVDSFNNMVGKIGQKPQRATLVKLYFEPTVIIQVLSKTLPVQQLSKDQLPDGLKLGEGPIHLENMK